MMLGFLFLLVMPLADVVETGHFRESHVQAESYSDKEAWAKKNLNSYAVKLHSDKERALSLLSLLSLKELNLFLASVKKQNFHQLDLLDQLDLLQQWIVKKKQQNLLEQLEKKDVKAQRQLEKKSSKDGHQRILRRLPLPRNILVSLAKLVFPQFENSSHAQKEMILNYLALAYLNHSEQRIKDLARNLGRLDVYKKMTTDLQLAYFRENLEK